MLSVYLRANVRGTLDTVICCTRYGNVMAGRGSVIPHFIKQIQDGLPITVTDPNMTRFMMTIEDAVDLVVYAFQHGNPGDIFVQKAPACTIGVLAEALKKLLKAHPQYSVTHPGILGCRPARSSGNGSLYGFECKSAEEIQWRSLGGNGKPGRLLHAVHAIVSRFGT